MMKCKHCGLDVDSSSKFCEYCGKKLRRTTNPWLVVSILLMAVGSIGIIFLSESNQEALHGKDEEIMRIEEQMRECENQNQEIVQKNEKLEEKNQFFRSVYEPAKCCVMPYNGRSWVSFPNGIILDPGGTGDYANYCDSYLVVNSGENHDCGVCIQGDYNMEQNCDYLEFYEGTTTEAKFLAKYTGTGRCNVTSYSGVLLIHFHSDGSVVRSGFVLSATCFSSDEPPIQTTSIKASKGRGK